VGVPAISLRGSEDKKRGGDSPGLGLCTPRLKEVGECGCCLQISQKVDKKTKKKKGGGATHQGWCWHPLSKEVVRFACKNLEVEKKNGGGALTNADAWRAVSQVGG